MGAAFCFVFYFASVFNEGLPCVLYFKSVAGVWFAFKNLVGALDFFSSFSPAPRRCGAHYRKPKAAPLLCTKMLLTTATTTHIAARRQPPRRLACFAPRRRGRKPRKQRRRGLTTTTPQCKYNEIKRRKHDAALPVSSRRWCTTQGISEGEE